jgi:hypothetical protein
VILGRFGSSAIVCRAVATYELAGMRAAKKLEKSENVQQTEDIELEERGVVIKSEVSTDKDGSRSRLACILQERATM